MRNIESIFVRMDLLPWSGLLRILLGVLLALGHSVLCAKTCPVWLTVSVFLFCLLLLRAIPLIIRKVLPFSGQVQSIWEFRRRLGKSYDSYQWQKLFWVGLGMDIVLLTSAETHASIWSIAAIATFGGALGLVAWNRIIKKNGIVLAVTELKALRK